MGTGDANAPANAARTRNSAEVGRPSARQQRTITAGSIFGDTFDACGGGDGDGNGRGTPSLMSRRTAAARASKLARAEAEAFADVQVKAPQ